MIMVVLKPVKAMSFKNKHLIVCPIQLDTILIIITKNLNLETKFSYPDPIENGS